MQNVSGVKTMRSVPFHQSSILHRVIEIKDELKSTVDLHVPNALTDP